MITKKTFVQGIKKGIKVIVELSKYIIPSVFAIKVLEHSGLLERISAYMAPYMSYIGLPGEGALILLFGQVSMYGAIGAMIPLGLTAKQITICCSMISICHAIILETAIVTKGGANGFLNAGIRFLAAVATGVVLNTIIPGV